MSRVKIENNQLIITIKGIRKFFAVRNKLTIPLCSVIDATTDFKWKDTPRPFQKRIGSDIYGFYFGGTFKQKGNKVFYDLRKKEDAVLIKLKNTKFDTLVIGVDNPDETVRFIKQALK